MSCFCFLEPQHDGKVGRANKKRVAVPSYAGSELVCLTCLCVCLYGMHVPVNGIGEDR